MSVFDIDCGYSLGTVMLFLDLVVRYQLNSFNWQIVLMSYLVLIGSLWVVVVVCLV